MTGTLADRCRLIREHAGIGLMEAKRALILAEESDFAGDVILAVAYLDAAGFAVHVKGDRHAWNLDRARERTAGLRERHPELDEAFPLPSASPAP